MDIDALDTEGLKIILIAAALGAVLGIEREIAGKPAGIRTHILVSAGSALMMILGQQIITQFHEQDPESAIESDPIRILQAIVIGISFLGAGTIVHDHDTPQGVEGLTTAATIYLTAGIGVATALGRTQFALIITIFAACVLILIGGIEYRVRRWRARRSQ